jgi:hypothetical protein
MTLETAAPGSQLLAVLRSSGSHRRKSRLVESILSWLVEVAAETRHEHSLGSLLDARSASLFPFDGLDEDELTLPLRDLPTTLAHADLGLEHVIVDEDSFVAIDWEGAERHGVPLTDLAYFLVRVLPVLDGEIDAVRFSQAEVFARLFRGESASAAVLRHWLRLGSEASGVPLELVGRVLSVVWLTYLDEHRRHFAETWFADPTLGPGWTLS